MLELFKNNIRDPRSQDPDFLELYSWSNRTNSKPEVASSNYEQCYLNSSEATLYTLNTCET